MRENYFVFFLDTPNADTEILGRRARDWVLREFYDVPHCVLEGGASTDFKTLSEAADISDSAYYFVLYLDMPLVTKKLLETLTAEASRRLLLRIEFPDGFMQMTAAGDNQQKYFLRTEDFSRLDNAKSMAIVYNSLKERINTRLISQGVYIPDPQCVYIDDTAEIEEGAAIYPLTYIKGSSRIRSGATIISSYIDCGEVEEGARVAYSYITSSIVRKGSEVGPFARLRGADIGEHCRIGDFVEVKASKLHKGVKAAHLTYIGDAEVGDNTNIGCGTVFCNYDGKKKHRTRVGKNSFIGANVNLVAPVTIGDEVFIAAGTTVTKDINDGEFCIGRVRQETKARKKDEADSGAGKPDG
ncbi:MAG: hypothetical protein GX891_03380 [Clostridiales bacterium]|nr:hypothetical protein [Clostridiales bacterium]